MKPVNLLLWAGLLLFVVGCSVSDPEAHQAENVPWTEASFIDPLLTEITFTNADDVPHTLGTDLRGYYEDLGDRIPDSLLAGESVTLTVELHYPRYLYHGSGDFHSTRLVLPGYARHLVHEQDTVRERGDYAAEYAYIDAVIMPLNLPRQVAPDISSLDDFWKSKNRTARAHLDSLEIPEGLPDYIPSLIGRSVEINSYSTTLSMRSFYRLFRKDTLAVSSAMTDSISALLKRPGYYQTPEYNGLYEKLSTYKGETTLPVSTSVSANIHAGITAGYLDGYPVPARQYDAIGERIAQDITNPRVYSGKMENMDTLLSLLPEAYRNKLAKIQREAIAAAASEHGLVNFIETTYDTPEGGEASVNELGTKPLRLLKFWFAGCMPCLIQQPNEAELLAKHPEVDLIYIAHNTDKEEWEKYLVRHKPPTALQLYVPLKERTAIQSAAGTTGAPTYVMVDDAGEMICRPCPKPSDPLLDKIIEGALEHR